MKKLPFLLFCLGWGLPLFAQTAPAGTSLASLRAAYESAYATEVTIAHSKALEDLNVKFTAALDRALEAATEAGDLDLALALRDEMKRVGDGRPLPANDDAAPPAMKPLRQTYRSALTSLDAGRARLAAPLNARYDQTLGALQTELTKAGDLDGALAVKNLRAQIQSGAVASARAPTPAPPPVARPGTAPESAAVKPGKYDAAAARVIIDWIFSGKGEIRVSTDGGNKDFLVRGPQELPKGPFLLMGIWHGLGVQTVPEGPFPWSSLDGVPTLRDLRLRQAGPILPEQIRHIVSLPKLNAAILPTAKLPLESIQSLPVLPELRRIISFHPTNLPPDSDALLAALVEKLPNLEEADFTGRFPVTDRNIDLYLGWKRLRRLVLQGQINGGILRKLATLSNFQSLSLFGSGSTVEASAVPGLKDLTGLEMQVSPQFKTVIPYLKSLPKLDHLRIQNVKLTTSDLEPVLALKIKSLVIPGNPALNDQTLARIAEMHGLKRLDIRETAAFTDAGLLHLTAIKGLEEIQITKTGITAAGIAAFQKELPNCRVIR